VQEFLPFIVIGLATGAVYGLAGIGLVLTYKTSGIFNFGYGAIAALVAFCFYFLNEHGLPWGVSAAISLLVFAPILGLILELMARSLSGAGETIKVVATVGLILIVESLGSLWYPTNPPTFPNFLPQSTARMLGVNVTWEQIILFLFSAVAAAALYWFFRSVRSGIVMRGVVDNADLVAMSGDDPVLVRRRAWIIGSVFAGVAGLFLAPTQLLDGATLTTAVFAAVGYSVIPAYLTSPTTTSVLNLIFGLGAATAALASGKGTTPEPVRRLLDRLGDRKPAPDTVPTTDGPTTDGPTTDGPTTDGPTTDRPRVAAPAAVVARAHGAHDAPAKQVLVVRDLSVRFGGVQAVNGVSLKAPAGKITGLIGPNGAGKTTTFDACSALVRASSGQIVLHDTDVTREGPSRRARQGLGRTFQRTELFSSLTVRQNVAMGREASMAGANPLAQVFGSRRSNRLISAVVDEALKLTGTTRIADAQVGLLPIGQRRLVELARALAGPFDMLLLDEPSSGLDGHETEQFGQVLQTVARERGCGILLVEHDMTLVREVCDHVYVLDFGQLIFEGTAGEMQNSARVRAAYLGGSEDTPDADEPDLEDWPFEADARRPLMTGE
jgi:ABC-type branched-subunit amino acid transport system ATPase component/branched-subunit amino acid ABC-type transport system permease component